MALAAAGPLRSPGSQRSKARLPLPGLCQHHYLPYCCCGGPYTQPCPPSAAQSKPSRGDPAPLPTLVQRRQTAYDCWRDSGADIRRACAAFRAHPHGASEKNASRFIHRARALLGANGSLHSPRRTGRKAKVTAEQAQRALDLLWKGYVSEGRRRYYTSIKQACDNNKGLAAIIKECGCKPRTLLSAMRQLEPTCRRRREAVKRLLTAENRAARLASSRALLEWPLDKLRRVFWIDAATIYCSPKSLAVYAPPGSHLVITDERVPSHSTQLRKLKFYICINAILGPVALVFITGTSEHRTEEEWLVSAGYRGRSRQGRCTRQQAGYEAV